MAPPAAGVHIVIVGGVSVNDPGSHDQFPYNFINPAARRAIAFKGNTHVLMFTPPYEKRVRDQKKEHSTVQYSVVDECSLPLPVNYCPRFFIHKAKNPYHFLDVMKGSGSKNGFSVTSIATADELTAAIDGFPAIETIHYFGHSNPGSMFLQYSTTGHPPAVGEVVWGEADAKKIKPAKFTAGATFATYGCNQGEIGGLADRVRDLWKIRTIGSQGKTDFETIGQGQTFPKSAGGYYEYPTPSLAADGKTWGYPARRALTAPF